VPNPDDGRGTLAVITAAGRDAMEAATADLVRARFSLGMLTASEHEQLFDILRKVRVGAADFDG
jgi:DNA-binding MarR family transcriptional regulator